MKKLNRGGVQEIERFPKNTTNDDELQEECVHSALCCAVDVPTTYEEAVSSLDKQFWMDAISKEFIKDDLICKLRKLMWS